MISVIIVEDQPDVAEAIHLAITSEIDIEVAAICHTLAPSGEVVGRYHPDVVLTDFRLADGDAVDAFSSWHTVSPSTRVLVLSAWSDDRSLQRAREAGARGYLEKGPDLDALCTAIRTVAGGGEHWLGRTDDGVTSPPAAESGDPLSDDIERRLASGGSTEFIATALGVSERTVRLRVNGLLRSHGVRTRAELLSRLGGTR